MGPLAWGIQMWFGDLLDNARVGIWGTEHKQKREAWEEGREGGKVFFGGSMEDLLKETHSKCSGS